MSKTILIVDDSATVRREVMAALEGFDFIEACDGEEGAQFIQTRDDISLVFCDVNMPKLTGIEMLERVQSRAKEKALKIVMLTTEGQPGMVKKARGLGAVGWIVKPFNPTQLRAAAQKLTS